MFNMLQLKTKINNLSPLWKYIAIVTLIVYIIGNLIAWISPATGVEIDIYKSTPQFYWIALIVTYISGIWITLHSLTIHEGKKICRITGYTLLTLACISLVGLTTIRGYYLLNVSTPQDMAFHFACVNDILEYGTFNTHANNPYPLTHIAYSIYHLLTGTELRILINVLPIFGTIIFLGGTYFLAKRIFKNKNVLPFIWIFLSIVPFGSVTLISWNLTQPMPTTFSYYILPLLFAIILMTIQYKNQLVLIPTAILTFFAVFIHPLTLFIVIGFIFSVFISTLVQYRHTHNRNEFHNIMKIIIVSIIISGISFFLWHFSTRIHTIGAIIASILSPVTDGNNAITTSYLSSLSTGFSLGYNIFDILKMGSINLIIYGLIFIACIYFILKKDYLENDWKNISIIFIFSILIIGLTGVIALTNSGVHCSRYMALLTMSGILCTGYLCYKIYNSKSRTHPLVKFGTFALIAGIVTLSVICYFPSPITKTVMNHDTISEITAIETLVPVIDITYDREWIYFNLDRSYPYLYGLGEYKSVIGTNEYSLSTGNSLHYSSNTMQEKEPIFHFRYNTVSNYGDAINKQTYLFLWKKDIDYYPAYVPELLPQRFTKTDYEHLYTDNTVKQYYNSGEITAYLIEPSK